MLSIWPPLRSNRPERFVISSSDMAGSLFFQICWRAFIENILDHFFGLSIPHAFCLADDYLINSHAAHPWIAGGCGGKWWIYYPKPQCYPNLCVVCAYSWLGSPGGGAGTGWGEGAGERDIEGDSGVVCRINLNYYLENVVWWVNFAMWLLNGR